MTQRVFLSGPMGSGKSRIARALGELWRTAPVDLDERIERLAGASVAQVFERHGEARFRALELEALGRVLADPQARVIALGGGTVTQREARRNLLRQGTLVTLRASLDTLCARVGSGRDRPLLHGGDIRERLTSLLSQRAEAYAECHAELDTDARDPLQLAQEIDRIVSAQPIAVPMGLRTYRVEVGPGVRHALPERVRAATTGKHVVLVTDTGVREPWATRLERDLLDAGKSVALVCLPAGEEHKNIESIGMIWDAALDAGVDRDALVVAVGGGVVGDMAGFAAATILRGIACGQVPTTLLAMVDSAVGGKTGIDRRQGKNLIGAFQQPRFVLCDTETLSTLPAAERRAGLAEVVKSAWLDGEASVALLEDSARALLDGEFEATGRAVRMSVELKARIVTEDEHETGARALLNLGHTVGHAIEVASGFGALRHGEAVSLGMVAAFRLAARLGHAQVEHGERVARLLARVGLPIDVDRYLDERTLAFLGADKKRKGGKVRFIVPSAPGKTEIVALSEDEVKRLVLP
ncbi:MAG: 3-dehydroquinate synthase, partial [Myxococcaceae bacterium]|nr:3-dehydroquinate synthase [Myxococcaceae bacterium]